MAAVIEVEGLTKRYQKQPTNAVDEVSFSVESGAFFTLLGPNGAGKTTTLSILTTTLLPTSGKVRVAGYDVVRGSGTVRKNIGIIFQKPSLDLNLTAEENVRFHAVLYGLYPFRPLFRLMPRDYQTRVEQLSAILDIESEMFKLVKQFSGGMKRKMEIVRSLIHNPRVLFLDEPTTGLDPASRRNLWDYLKQSRRDQGTTIFLTTHYLEEAEASDAISKQGHASTGVHYVTIGHQRSANHGNSIGVNALMNICANRFLSSMLLRLGVAPNGVLLSPRVFAGEYGTAMAGIGATIKIGEGVTIATAQTWSGSHRRDFMKPTP